MEKRGEARFLPATLSGLKPGDFPLGSLQSRAAARALLNSPVPLLTSQSCICFRENELLYVGFSVELEIAARLKCPLHGERFKLTSHAYFPKWVRRIVWRTLDARSEQYQKAWSASFPPELWPAKEIETPDGKLFLQLKDRTRILAVEPDWKSIPPRHPIEGSGVEADTRTSEVCYMPRWATEIYDRHDPRSEAIDRELLGDDRLLQVGLGSRDPERIIR